jgi:hypothetical protein
MSENCQSFQYPFHKLLPSVALYITSTTMYYGFGFRLQFSQNTSIRENRYDIRDKIREKQMLEKFVVIKLDICIQKH